MSSRSATRRASPASTAEQHPFLLSRRESASPVCAPVRMNRPTTSYPCSFSRTADAELSTPPDMASTTRPGMGLLIDRSVGQVSNLSYTTSQPVQERPPAAVSGGHPDHAGDEHDQQPPPQRRHPPLE